MSELEALASELDVLAQRGAASADRVGFVQAQELLCRARARRSGVARRLLPRLAGLMAQLERACEESSAVKCQQETVGADTASPWQDIFDRLDAECQPQDTSAAALPFDGQLRQQESHIFGVVQWPPDTSGVAPGDELRAARRLKLDQRVRQRQDRIARSLRKQPENPGPLNPQMLAVKALTLMGSLSASYTNRFVSYIETLSSLEGSADQGKRGKSPGKAAAGARTRKRKS